MPTPQPNRAPPKSGPQTPPVKTANKAEIAKAFDNKSPSVKQRVLQWQEHGGGVKKPPEVRHPMHTDTTHKITTDADTAKITTSKSEILVEESIGDTKGISTSDPAIFGGEPSDIATKPQSEASQIRQKPASKPKSSNPKKRQISATRIKIAQAIIGPTIRPSERQRRLSEAKKERDIQTVGPNTSGDTQAVSISEHKENATIHEKESADERKDSLQDSPRLSGKKKEVVAPKKRIVSDGHWRKARDTANIITEIQTPNSKKYGGSKPQTIDPSLTVEKWLNFTPSKPNTNICNDGDEPEPKLDCDIAAVERGRDDELSQNEYDTLARAEREATTNSNSRTALQISDETPNRQRTRVPHSIGSEGDASPSGNRVASKRSTRNEKQSRKPLSAPSSIIRSETAAVRSQNKSDFTVQEPHPGFSDSCDSTDSHSEYSDHLTSISRRPPPKKVPGQTKRKILGHATKLFTRPEPKFDPAKVLPPGPVRVPTIESWLDRMQDPFVGIHVPPNDRSGQDRAVSNETDPKTKALSNSRSPTAGLDMVVTAAQGSENLTELRDMIVSALPETSAEEDPGKLRRARRVLRHRDGTVTFEDDGVSNEPPPGSPHLRRRKANRRARSDPLEQSRPDLSYTMDKNSMLPHESDKKQALIEGGERNQTLQKSRLVGYDGTLPVIKRDTDTVEPSVKRLLGDPDVVDDHSVAEQDTQRAGLAKQLAKKRQVSIQAAKVAGGKSHRLAKHSDLMTVLSSPRGNGSSIRSARSVRTHRSRLATTTKEGLMEEFGMDETKYMRELYTLVDGVIPVLLSSILSRANSIVAAGLFNPNATMKDAESFSKPVFEMGVALEKLKIQHEKAPRENVDSLVTWAEQIVPFYSKYLQAWRMGFQDVVVNLANQDGSDDESQNDKGMPLNADGDVVDTNGERVDVAYLLKRPLVRLKYLSKTLKGINHLISTERCLLVHMTFTKLVDEAKRRAQAEQARLEDEAADALDPTKARDLRCLGPTENVSIQHNMRVKARDTFDLELNHSSGQMLDCRAELFLREDPQNPANRSDLLIAEVDGTGRWLLFPPIDSSNVSARIGNCEGEIVVMIRGESEAGFSWYEVVTLLSEEAQTSFDWVQMLGLHPIPPVVERHQHRSTLTHTEISHGRSSKHDVVSVLTLSSIGPDPSDFEQVQIPIGERPFGLVRHPQGVIETRSWKRLSRHSPSTIIEETSSALAADEVKKIDAAQNTPQSLGTSRPPTTETIKDSKKCTDSTSGVHRSRLIDSHRKGVEITSSGLPSPPKQPAVIATRNLNDECQSENNLSKPIFQHASSNDQKSLGNVLRITPARYHTKKSNVMPSQPQQLSRNIIEESSVAISGSDGRDVSTQPVVLDNSVAKPKTDGRLLETIRSQQHTAPAQLADNPTGVHDFSKSSTSSQQELNHVPRRLHRRTSSPLKHEYEPSSTSGSSDESEVSLLSPNGSSMSDSSESDLDDADTHSILVPVSAVRRYRKAPRTATPGSLPDGSLSPSQSASQAPYREVPNQPGKESRAVALISFWSERGRWESLCSNECLIIVSPGLIEAYMVNDRLRENESSKESTLPKLLLGLELTPLVPIRRGTALDISIRSPPISDSKITAKSNNNFLFRSRGPEECEALYMLIHQSRINNPTYIALQNARATSYTPNFQEYDRRSSNKAGKSASWFGLGRTHSYRASKADSPSISRHTESSVGSLSSAFSAFRNFGRGNGKFNLAKSTVSSRFGSGSTSLHTSSAGAGASGNSGSAFPLNTTSGIGLSNCKIRLYIRENNNKWADLGSARLTIMKPGNSANATSSNALDTALATPIEHAGLEVIAGHGVGMASSGGYASPGNKVTANDKRIVVTASPNSLIIADEQPRHLLDVTLGETCFERVARTGIAVSVWENFEGGMVAKKGGVVGGRLRVYMMQFKNEADTAYTYSIVGKLRY